jgi:hypothetical protein
MHELYNLLFGTTFAPRFVPEVLALIMVALAKIPSPGKGALAVFLAQKTKKATASGGSSLFPVWQTLKTTEVDLRFAAIVSCGSDNQAAPRKLLLLACGLSSRLSSLGGLLSGRCGLGGFLCHGIKLLKIFTGDWKNIPP